MTVERLIELLREQYPMALVSVTLRPCGVGGLPNSRQRLPEGPLVYVWCRGRDGQVHLVADQHHC